MRKIKVKIGIAYEILIGYNIFPDIDLSLSAADKIGIIVSSRVYDIHRQYIDQSFKEYKNLSVLIMNDGEENKNYGYAEEFLNSLLKKGFSRKSVVIGIGGGVVGDFAGFIASVFMRGLPVIHIPTTLLAMVDSSIGGKVAVNISSGKNIVGVFHQPDTVISDTRFLDTLPDIELKNGITETVKHALIGEKRLAGILSNNDLKTIRRREVMEEMIYLSAAFKASVVERDEKESGLRSILNFGHTIGHAIESFMNYKNVSHGEAVAIGLKAAMEISRRMGLASEVDADLCYGLLEKYDLIYSGLKFDPVAIVDHMKYDKKNFSGKINFVLLNGISNPVYNQSVDGDILKEVIGRI